MAKTIKEINEKIKKGKAFVVTAEEMIDVVGQEGPTKASEKVDVVTTATFGPMCSSGVFINFGHTKPKIKAQKVWLNDVPAYAGIAAVDIYIGATELQEGDPANAIFPGRFKYGGGHVIEDLVAGKDIKLKATSYGTDCYPRKGLETWVNIRDLNETILFNPRNSYQNYNVAVNKSDNIIYTYMGTLKPNLGNANYCSAGQLSPLLNDPNYETIGIGTRIFLAGGIGYVVWWGTQHNPGVNRGENQVPKGPAGSMAVIGDLKQASVEYLRGTSMLGYGVTLSVGIGVPIPVLNERIAKFTSVKDEDIYTQVVDYSYNYPQGVKDSLGEVNYKELRSGKITLNGKEIPTGSLSSYAKARKIASTLKEQIQRGEFLLSQPMAKFPGKEEGYVFKPLRERK